MKIFIGTLIGVAVLLLVLLLCNALQYESKCRQQGGFPLKGVCLKADTIKVEY